MSDLTKLTMAGCNKIEGGTLRDVSRLVHLKELVFAGTALLAESTV